MKYFASVLILLVMCFSCGVTSPHKKQNIPFSRYDGHNCSQFYSYQGLWIDLETLKSVEADHLPIDFKFCSKYAYRFNSPISDSIVLNGQSFVVENNEDAKKYNLLIFSDGKLKKKVKLPVDDPLPEVREYYINLIPYKNEVIMYMSDMYTTHYYIVKYDQDGNQLMRKDIEHTYVTVEGNVHEHHPYLYFSYLTTKNMIFSSNSPFSDRTKTVVLSMEDFSVKEYPQTSDGIILDENEEDLIGFISFDDKAKTHKVTKVTGEKFNIELGKYPDPSCETLVKDNYLFVANYHPIATGSSLYCFDLTTGKNIWTADVLQVNASHSKYYNHVTLSLYEDKLIMEGNEAYGQYLQIFDCKTGKRLVNFGPGLD